MKQIEIKEKRKEREKHFLQENGEIIAEVYDEDIHYLKNGKYEEIDNTLVKNYGSYVNKNNNFKLSFDTSSANIMTLKYEDKQIKIRLKNCNEVEPTNINNENKLHSSIEYKNIVDNIDLRYKLFPNKLKEDIILKTKDALQQELIFEIETDFKIRMQDSNTITFYKNDKSIFSIDAPYMMDSNGVYNDNVYYNLKELNDKYELKLVLDTNWLNSEDIKYPVIIDPTITNSGENNSVYDTYIYPGDTNDTRYNKDVLKVGVEKVNGTNRINRALLKFTLPTIGTGDQIVNATLNLVGYAISNGSYTDSKIINVHQVTESWTESGANWNNMNDKYNPRVENCFKSKRSMPYDNETMYEFVSCDLTNIVKKWYSDTPNYGIMLKLNNEVYTTSCLPSFYSKNNVDEIDPRPVLTVTYYNQNGLEDYMKYYNQELSRGMIYENMYNGNLTASFDIGSTISGKMPIDLKIVYNTNDVVLNNSYGYGQGYKLNLYQTIKEVIIDDSNYLQFIDEDGTVHYLEEFDDNFYCDEDGINLVVEKKDNMYIMSDADNNKWKFIKINNIAYLSEIIDNYNNRINIYYDSYNRIIKVVDANNSNIDLIYEENKITVISPDETLYIEYNENKLISIDSITGVTSFNYNENNLIQSITDETGIQLLFNYYEQTPYRLKQIAEYGIDSQKGNVIDISYSFNSTKVKDIKNIPEIITFNSIGNPISHIRLENNNSIKNAYGQKEIYGNSASEKNKLISSFLPEKHVNNYLLNSNFSQDIIYFLGEGVQISITNEDSYSGNKCLKIKNDSYNKISQCTTTVPKNNYYTFSAYIKNSNNMKLALAYTDIYDNEVIVESKTILPKSEFEREDITIFYPNDNEAVSNLYIKIISLTVGTIYIDNIQLEEGKVANLYNYVENSSFYNGLLNWTTSLSVRLYEGEDEFGLDDTVFQLVEIEPGIKALKVNMEPRYTTELIQEISINGIKGDIYNLSFWYKSRGVKPLDDEKNNYAILSFVYDNGENSEVINEQLNSDCEEWQYFTTSFTADTSFSKMILSFKQLFNANDFYITNIAVYKDSGSINYNYNENGNIVSINGLNNTNLGFSYDKNNQLTKISSQDNSDFIAEYDTKNIDRLINQISETGIESKMIYDVDGNIVATKIINFNTNKEVTEGLYQIRVKGTQCYLKNVNNNIKLSEEYCATNKWKLEKHEDYFRIRHSIISNQYLSCEKDKVILSDKNSDSSLFTLKRKENSYYIILKKANAEDEEKYLKYANDTLIIAPLEANNVSFEFYFESDDCKEFIENNCIYTDDGKYISSIVNPVLSETNYNINNITGNIESIIDPNGIISCKSYNDKQQLVKVKSGNQSVEYSYNNQNLLEKIKLGNKEYNFVYNEFLNLIQIKLGSNLLITNNYEEKNGNLVSTAYGNGHTISFTYDNFNRIEKVTKMNNTYNYMFGNNGNLLKVLDNNNIITQFIYDTAKRIKCYKFDDFSIRYNYDINDNIINKQYLLNNYKINISNSYNEEGTITQIVYDTNEINYNYDSLGRIYNKKINNNYNIDYDYVTNGYRTSLLIKSITNNSEKYTYKYDKSNNITHIYYNDILINRYFYDEYNQLEKENNYKDNITIKYKYDIYGNILNKKIYNLNDNSFIRKDIYEYNNPQWKDQLTKFNKTLVTYDEIGNPKTLGNAVLTWVNGRELSSYIDSKNNILYQYNEDGIRISKTVNNKNIKYYLEDNQIIFESRNNDMIYYMRDENGNLEGLKYNNDTFYYIKNIQNDIIGILDSNYNKVANYEYDSWGKILAIKDDNHNEITDLSHIAHINPFRYRSYYYDNETGLYYLNSRYYNPEWGRFINTDTQFDENADLLGYNLYIYCGNNPITYIDEDGESVTITCILIASGVGLLIGGIYGSRKAKKKKLTPKDGWKYWKYVIKYGVLGASIGALVGYGAGTLIARYGVSAAARSITKGGGARFSSYSSLKRSMGNAGIGKEWHHIVEQCQIKKSGFSKYWIQNSNNVIKLNKYQHKLISKHYSSKFRSTHGLTVRDWLRGKSFSYQYKYGVKILRKFGVRI